MVILFYGKKVDYKQPQITLYNSIESQLVEHQYH